MRLTTSSMSSTRLAGRPMVCAARVRISRPVRPACWAEASSRTPTSRPGLGRSVNRRPSDGGGAGGRLGEADHHPHGRGLAGAVGAEETGDAAGSGGEGDVVDGDGGAVAFGESFHGDHLRVLRGEGGCVGRAEAVAPWCPAVGLGGPGRLGGKRQRRSRCGERPSPDLVSWAVKLRDPIGDPVPACGPAPVDRLVAGADCPCLGRGRPWPFPLASCGGGRYGSVWSSRRRPRRSRHPGTWAASALLAAQDADTEHVQDP